MRRHFFFNVIFKFQFIHLFYKLCMIICIGIAPKPTVFIHFFSSTGNFCETCFLFHTELIYVKFIWGDVLLEENHTNKKQKQTNKNKTQT